MTSLQDYLRIISNARQRYDYILKPGEYSGRVLATRSYTDSTTDGTKFEVYKSNSKQEGCFGVYKKYSTRKFLGNEYPAELCKGMEKIISALHEIEKTPTALETISKAEIHRREHQFDKAIALTKKERKFIDSWATNFVDRPGNVELYNEGDGKPLSTGIHEIGKAQAKQYRQDLLHYHDIPAFKPIDGRKLHNKLVCGFCGKIEIDTGGYVCVRCSLEGAGMLLRNNPDLKNNIRFCSEYFREKTHRN